ncbi:uncharacterized protein LOC116110881 [Pistacia vera]|uniref:Uncharacterized protein n=1 Tax=Pistacia atlantica TaxID=434234 RepID=A0ACC1AMX7_9ROSI|nr:uncharacterized protein LOC116110881 [Pistacia vera]KAJ0087983.1 hypothetical protein Patl1_32060 [Pistacia atlantica]
MDFKPSFINLFLLLLLLVFLAQPRFSIGGSMEMGSTSESDVYEIDYKGPETHSSIPPPDHSYRKKPMIHRERAVAFPKSNGAKGGNTLANGRKIHG